ncbi:J domain-containing protein [Legionella yabuuchiae]|uniref:J domain-containing protein n=1 Tax=Legionella yabuuchiae TaxID=376727 RepID=UPI0010546A75|nr:J domain-containing protein [Legionella yabuuchiae]
MIDYYQCLGIDSKASSEDIKRAYRRLALIHHPDRPTGNKEQFERINEAYQVLGNPDKRILYDDPSLSSFDAYLVRYKRENLDFQLVDNPHQYDHYTYVNLHLKLQGSQQFTKGHVNMPYEELWEKLSYISHIIQKRAELLEKKTTRTNVEEETLKKIGETSRKNAEVRNIFRFDKKKALYDLTLGIVQSEEISAIEQEIGGKAPLMAYLKEVPYLNIAEAVFALHTARILTPMTFKQLAEWREDKSKFSGISISSALSDLLSAGLLTLENFNFLLKQKQYIAEIDFGFARIKLHGLLNQKLFEIVVNAGKDARDVGSNIEFLEDFLNEINLQLISKTIPQVAFCVLLRGHSTEGLFTKEQSQIFHWQGPQPISNLLHQIDQMFAYGLYLFTCDVEKGKTAIRLALDLRQELKNFFELPEHTQEAMEEFKRSFVKTLHSKDSEMSTHRAFWKVIVANIFIALTGIGLFALGWQYAQQGQLFFAKTNRQKLIDSVEKEAEHAWEQHGCFSFASPG